MKLFVLGATGATGTKVLEQALEAGHEVTAYVRNPAKIKTAHPNLKVVQGGLDEAERLKAEMKGHDAVISALGHNRLLDASPFVAKAVETVLEGMQEHGISRIFYESAYGVGDSEKDMSFVLGKIIKPLFLRHPFADHKRAEDLIKRSDRDWLIAKPTILTNGPLTRRYLEKERLPLHAKGRISRADVAHFLVKNLDESRITKRSVGLTAE